MPGSAASEPPGVDWGTVCVSECDGDMVEHFNLVSEWLARNCRPEILVRVVMQFLWQLKDSVFQLPDPFVVFCVIVVLVAAAWPVVSRLHLRLPNPEDYGIDEEELRSDKQAGIKPVSWQMSNGASYAGKVAIWTGKRHGHGTYTYADGNRYCGQWVDGGMTGEGKMEYANGDSYQGQYVKGVKEGEGTETYAAPSTARDEDGDGDGGSGDGGSGDAQPAPDAVLVDGVDISGGWYEGEWSDNAYDGKGKRLFPDGVLYSGDFVCGLPEGHGRLNSDGGGTKYKGQFLTGVQSGQGTTVYANGSRHKGEYKGGKAHGQGSIVHADRQASTYHGEFEDGLPSGKGVQTLGGGRSYEGQFCRGLRHGHGTFTFGGAGGKFSKGNVFEGKPVGTHEVTDKDGAVSEHIYTTLKPTTSCAT